MKDNIEEVKKQLDYIEALAIDIRDANIPRTKAKELIEHLVVFRSVISQLFPQPLTDKELREQIRECLRDKRCYEDSPYCDRGCKVYRTEVALELLDALLQQKIEQERERVFRQAEEFLDDRSIAYRGESWQALKGGE